MSKNEIIDNSGDNKYFVQVPEIVRASTNLYEQSFWETLKMICGKDKKCTAGLTLLARLAKMSVGKASEARDSLRKKGLIRGGPINPKNKTSPWKITVPDLWRINIEWRAKVGDSLYRRAEIYENLLSDPKLNVFSLHEKHFSCGEKPNFSRGEKSFSRGEKKKRQKKDDNINPDNALGENSGFSPGEIKNNITIKDIKKKNTAPKNGAASPAPDDSPKPEKQPSEWQMLFGTLAEVCGFDIGIAPNAARVGKRLKELMQAKIHPTRELLLEHYGEPNGHAGWNWYRNDWRGKDKAPTPEQVGETWGNWKIIKDRTNSATPNVVVEDLGERTLREFGLA